MGITAALPHTGGSALWRSETEEAVGLERVALEGVVVDGGPSSLETAFEEFLRDLEQYRACSPNTVKAYRRDLSRFGRFMTQACGPGQFTPADVTPQHVQRHLQSLRHLSPNTIRRAAHALGSFFGWALSLGYVERNPVRGVLLPRRPEARPHCPPVEHCRELVRVAHTPLERAVIALLLTAGLRKSELIGLDLADYDAAAGELRVEGKGGRQRRVPIPADTVATLQAYLAHRGTAPGPLLLNRDGRRLGGTTVQRLFKRLLKRAGLEGHGYSIHSTRHAYGTLLMRSGVHVRTLQELLGHVNLGTTAVYLHADLSSKREAVACLPRLGACEDGAFAGSADLTGPPKQAAVTDHEAAHKMASGDTCSPSRFVGGQSPLG